MLATDLLQFILNEAMHNSLFKAPLTVMSCPNLSVIQYVDDTILVVFDEENQ